jgi:hypothetical protein
MLTRLNPWLARVKLGVRTFAHDVAQGFFAISHNSMAVVGLSAFFFVVALSVRPDLRTITEAKLVSWLQERQDEEMGLEASTEAVDRATAADPRDLPKQQANLAYWLSKKYRVAPQPLSALISEAYDIGPIIDVDPTLILAVMAVESGFNPFAQAHVGAQGLMQVMTSTHQDKYQGFGGTMAAFDPVANLRVGAYVLKDHIQRAGSVSGGLKLYVSAVNPQGDSAYVNKVLSEQGRLQQVAKGLKVPLSPPTTATEAATARLESLWEKAQSLKPFGKDNADNDPAD